MAARRKVLTGRDMHIPIGGTLLSKLGAIPEPGDLVGTLAEKLRLPAVEPLNDPEGAAMLKKLGGPERSLIMKALSRPGDCSAEAVRKFMALPPGIRELRSRKAIDSVWTSGRWMETPQFREGRFVSRAAAIEAEIVELEDAYPRALSKLGLKPPTPEERLAALKPSELTEGQRRIIAMAPAGAEGDEIRRFRSWAVRLKEAARESLWKSASPSVVSAASLVHKLRFCSKLDFTSDEIKLVQTISGKKAPEIPDLSSVKKAFSEGFKGDAQSKILETFRAAVWATAEHGLLDSARSCAEYRTLLDFLGIERKAAGAALRPERGICKGSLNLEGKHSTNDDSYVSLDLQTEGRTVRLDIVLDGVSGHHGGYVASGIAKETFEIASLAGWIASPEDARFAVVLADLVLQLEKQRYKLQRMGTTATISYLDGQDLYAIQCGDSAVKVVTDGAVVYSTTPHGIANRLWSGLGIGASMITVNDSNNSRFSQKKVAPGSWVLVFTDGAGDVICDHEYPLALKGARTSRKAANEIFALADGRRDRDKEYKPLCGCEALQGKDDDISIIAIYVE